MKTIKSLSLCICLLVISFVHAQKHSEIIKKEIQFPNQSSDNLLAVHNVFGSVTVEGYTGKNVEITGDLEIRGDDNLQLERGKKEVSMKVLTYKNIIYVYLDSPYTTFNPETGRYGHNENNRWRNYKNRDGYNYTLNIIVKVPKETSVELSTINSGVIKANNIEAKTISASNINGPITLENISGETYANALNKDITISYSKNPTVASTYKSLNGDINVSVQKGLNADVFFKSLNGDIFTNLDTQSTPSKIDVKKSSGKNGTKYKMNSKTTFSIGKGGVPLNFDVLNGDVTIKE